MINSAAHNLNVHLLSWFSVHQIIWSIGDSVFHILLYFFFYKELSLIPCGKALRLRVPSGSCNLDTKTSPPLYRNLLEMIYLTRKILNEAVRVMDGDKRYFLTKKGKYDYFASITKCSTGFESKVSIGLSGTPIMSASIFMFATLCFSERLK